MPRNFVAFLVELVLISAATRFHGFYSCNFGVKIFNPPRKFSSWGYEKNIALNEKSIILSVCPYNFLIVGARFHGFYSCNFGVKIWKCYVITGHKNATKFGNLPDCLEEKV